MRCRGIVFGWLSFAALLTACGGEGSQGSGTGTGGGGLAPAGGGPSFPCPPGERLVDDACVSAGLPDGWSMPGPATEPTPGVPPDGCGEGFAHDGLGGCVAILPDTACTGAEMAVPGDATCRAIAPCGTGPWGNIPVDASTVYVDQSFAGTPDGSESAPFPTIQAAVDAAPNGGLVAVAAGAYVEDVLIEGKAVALWGRCPEQVTITGIAGGAAILLVDAPGAEVHALAATGPHAGIIVVDSPSAAIAQVYVHDTPEPGVGALGPGPEVTLSDSLVEDVGIAGVVSQGALAVSNCEVRATATATGMSGMACYEPSNESPTPPSLTIDGCHIHDVHRLGVAAISTAVSVTRTVIADTVPEMGVGGWAILASDQDGPVAVVDVSQSVLARNVDANVHVLGGQVTLDAVTIEDALPSDEGFGTALSVYDGFIETQIGSAAVTRSVFRDTKRVAVDSYHGSVSLDEVLLQRVTSTTQSGGRGRGIFIGWGVDGSGPSELLVERSIIEQTLKEAVLSLGSSTVLRDSVIRDVTDADDGEIAVGVSVGPDPDAPAVHGQLLLERSRVEDVTGVGVFGRVANLEIVDSHVRNVEVLAATPGSGVGIIAGNKRDGLTTTLTTSGSLIEEVGSRAIVTIDSDVAIETSLIRRTRAEAPDQIGDGRAIEIQRGTLSLRDVEIANVSTTGLFVASSTADIEGLFVHDVGLGHDGTEGHGIGVATAATTPASAVIRGSRIERVHVLGVFGDGATVDIRDTLVADIASDAAGKFGRGIAGQRENGWLAVTHCHVEGAADSGVFVFDSSGEIVDTTIAHVRADDDDGLFGDGLLFASGASLQVRGCKIQDVERAALSSFGSQVGLGENDLRCNDLPLASETFDGEPSVLDDLGGNLCGCEQTKACKAVSAGLTPPEALPDSEAPPL